MSPEPNLNKKTSVICVSKLESKELSLISNILNVSNNESIIILNASDTRNVERAKELNVSYVFTPPLDREAILLAIRRSINKIVEAAWKDLKPAEEKALRQSVTSFDSCFDAAARGKRLPVSEVFSACESIQESMGVSNVDRWLGALRHHHDCTYRHSMYVCGALAFFAHAHGLRGQELKELTVGGFLHDAGKAQIPLGILDKPGKLDDDEWKIMRRHPEHSREILLRESGLTTEIVEMAVHHHEKLDGTGYPDGLSKSQINDRIRLTAISDVYAALTEERAYKPKMTNEKAFEIMQGFDPGHLDQELVKSFREFILDHISIQAA